MSLYGMMRTGVSGMNAQANRLSTVADNIANASTTGYKRSKTEFSSLLMSNMPNSYNSGGVNTTVMNTISQQGLLQYTTSASDLAVKGDGFFVVQNANGQTYLTRAGAFVPNAEGELVNAAGFKLMAYSYANGDPAATANGTAGLETVVIRDDELSADPSTIGLFKAKLPADAAPLPALTNAAGAQYTAKSSLVVYDNVGREVLVDVYFTKTADNTWDMQIYDQSLATPGTTFPYSAGPLATQTLTFDPANGSITNAPPEISFTVPGGQPFTMDLSQMSELGGEYTVLDAKANGNPPSPIDQIVIDGDGTIFAQYANGSLKPLYKIPLADVASPDRLTVLPGNVYSANQDSGDLQVGFAQTASLGTIVSGALENSNVDIAEELTTMIESQRTYTANSKVFQTGSDLMDVLVNLKR
ncbi:flagellar hook protein FlgE [Arvimicrobium flavum]|uniref:flagellar hook protein FlgE n=1 Tax=Arvimicrobium flavum TaxID=3393320 RepID=UPI00237B5341|nr:flagellar hook protein FlgE [Mesorhizobium shangrilense]